MSIYSPAQPSLILRAIGEVEGVIGQHVTVVDYVGADELNQIINTVFS